MKNLPWFIAIVLLLAACQPQPAIATPVAPVDTSSAVPTKAGSDIKLNTPEPTIAVTVTAQPVIHTSGEDPNAPNLIVVRDQPLADGSVTIDSVRAAQPGWLVIYLSKNDKPGHQLGYVAVQMGEVQQLRVPLDPKSGVSITEAFLAGRRLFAVLQSGPRAPGAPVVVAGRSVLEPFLVLPSAKP